MPVSLEELSSGSRLFLAVEGLVLLTGLVLWMAWFANGETRRGWLRADRLDATRVPATEILLFLCVVAMGAVLGQGLAAHALTWTEPAAFGGPQLLLGFGFHGGAIGAILCWEVWRRGFVPDSNTPAIASTTSDLPASLLLGAALFVAAVPVLFAAGVVWIRVLEYFELSTDQQDLVMIFQQTDSFGVKAVLVGMAIGIAPISEELIFRRGIYRPLRGRIGRFGAAIVSSVLFAALHGSWIAFVPLTLLGMLFCFGYERSGRISTPMVAHALFNLNTLVFLLSHPAP